MISKMLYNNYYNNRYKIHYLYENSIIIICLSEQVNDKEAFAFLYEVKETILKEYSVEELTNTMNSQLNKAKEILKTKMKYYNSNPISTTQGELIDNLELTKDAIFENIESLVNRNDKIGIIIDKSYNLKDSSYMISNLAQKLENKESERKNKYVVLVISLFFIVLILIYIFAT